MIVNPLALASKGYIGNDLSITIAFKGDVDSGGIAPDPKVHPSGGIDLRIQEEDDIFMIINAFLFMVSK